MQVWSLTAALVVASAGAVYDVFTHRIPNGLTYGGLIIGITFWVLMSGWQGFLTSILGALIAGGIFLVLYAIRTMGAGDVKLMAAVGAIAGPRRPLGHFVEPRTQEESSRCGVLLRRRKWRVEPTLGRFD